MNRPPFRAAFFDLDGTLIDTEPLHLDAERGALAQLGVAELASDHPRTFGMGIEPGMAVLDSRYGLGGVERVLDVYYPLWDAAVRERVELTAGAEPVLHAVAEAAIPMVLVTSGDFAYVDSVFRRLGVRSLFAAIVTSDDTAEMKPSPAPYLTAAARVGLGPEECIGFEDSGSGVEALVAAGVHAVAVHSESDVRPELAVANERIASFEEVSQARLEDWFGPSIAG